jgi:membrane-associated phospholipid phosphatase
MDRRRGLPIGGRAVNVMKSSSDDVAPAKPGGPGIAPPLPLSLWHNAVRNIARWCHVLERAPRFLIVRPPPANAIAAIVLTLVVIVASMFFIDNTASDWARHLPRWFTNTFEKITNSGLSGWLLVPLALIVFALAAVTSPALPRMTQGVLAALAARFGFLFWAIALPGLFATIVKRLIGRARPYAEIHDDPFTYMPFVWRSDYASLPSGHAATAAAAAFAIGAIWPRTRWVMWLYALMVMLSRVVLLSHHPSDVIAGALVGAVGAALVRRWFGARHLVFSPHDLSAYPGPSLKRIRAVFRQVVSGRGHLVKP